ncbi:MAG: acetyl-CoA hydrolase/transferase C-terminal domain-containing protein [Nocardioides sp.]
MPDWRDRLVGLVRPGDWVVWGQGPGAPAGLVECLLEERHRIGGFTTFSGYAFGLRLDPSYADVVRFTALGAFGDLRVLARAGVLDVVPAHMSDLPGLMATGRIRSDVVLVQVAPARAGAYSLGTAVQHLPTAIEHARVVVAEVNDQMPETSGYRLPVERVDFAVEVSRPLAEIPRQEPSDTVLAIARRVAELVPAHASLQLGVGSLPDSVLHGLHGRSDLGLHTGLVTDAVVDLVEATDSGFLELPVVTGAGFGTRRLYDWLASYPGVEVAGLDRTHDHAMLAAVPRLVSVNSALEVDLTGQVGAESVDGRTRGAVGGQVDYVRAANASPGGVSVIALPSTKPSGGSTIVRSLSGPVTTPRSDVRYVVTEHGVADLWGRTEAERAQQMAAVAHPDHRAELVR